MAKERDAFSIQGKIMTQKYGTVVCQHLYKWERFVIPTGFSEIRYMLNEARDNLKVRDLFIKFIEDPTDSNKVALLQETTGFVSLMDTWFPVSQQQGSPSWEALRWVYSEPSHYFEVLRVRFRIQEDIPPRYKQINSALIEFVTKQVPGTLPEGSSLPIPAPRAPYGSKSKSSDDSDSESEAAVVDPGREERIFSRTSNRVLEILEKAGLSLDSSDLKISEALVKASCPLAYQCQPGKDCPKCPRLHGILEELRKRKRQDVSAKKKPIQVEVKFNGSVDVLREAARNAAKAAVLDGLCREDANISKFVEQVLRGLF